MLGRNFMRTLRCPDAAYLPQDLCNTGLYCLGSNTPKTRRLGLSYKNACRTYMLSVMKLANCGLVESEQRKFFAG